MIEMSTYIGRPAVAVDDLDALALREAVRDLAQDFVIPACESQLDAAQVVRVQFRDNCKCLVRANLVCYRDVHDMHRGSQECH
jgi:hypothetical protein